jgi:hypothetical protein
MIKNEIYGHVCVGGGEYYHSERKVGRAYQ